MNTTSTIAIVAASVLLIGLGIPLDGDARPGGFPGGRFGPHVFLERHADELGLSQETLEAIEEITQHGMLAAEPLRQEMETQGLELRVRLNTDQPDEGAIMGLIEAIGDTRTRLQKEQIVVLLQIRRLLTPEQRDQLAVMRRQFRASRRARMFEDHPWSE